MINRLNSVILGTVSLFVIASLRSVSAQPNDQPSAGAQPGLEEIVVTARRTEEKLQQTPVSVTAFSAAKIEQQNITTVEGINNLVPNFSVLPGSGYGTAAVLTLRGVVQADNVLTNDAPVALYVDGVYNGRQMSALFDLVDIDRIEVLRGPQGTLFGRNTTGGAVSIITRKPSSDFHIEQKLGYASNNEFTSHTAVDTGEIGNSGISVLLAYSHHQLDGYVRNVLASADASPGAVDSDAGYVAVHGDLGDALSFDYRFDYTHQVDVPVATQLTAVSPDVLAYYSQSPSLGGDPFVVSQSRLSTIRMFGGNTGLNEILGHSLTVDYDVNDALHLKSITAYRSFGSRETVIEGSTGNLLAPVLNPATGQVTVAYVNPFRTYCPSRANPFDPFCGSDEQHQYQISQEIQVSGVWDHFKYVGGLFFFDEKVHETDPEFFTIVLPGGVVGINDQPITNYWSESKSHAAYGQASYTPPILDDKLELTGGLRYTFDEKTLRQRDFFGGVPLGAPTVRDLAKNFHKVNWAVSANYQWNDDLMLYARIANAYKAGGFSPRSFNDGYNPETDTSYEIGVKSEFFDRRLRVNADVFYTTYDDLQINVFRQTLSGAASETDNAGKATYTGGEIEISVIPATGWLIDASLGYTDPEYQQFLTVVPPSTTTTNVANQAYFNYVSKMTYNIGIEYDFEPFSFGALAVRADYGFQSPKVWHPLDALSPFNEIIKSGNYHNLSARITLGKIQTEAGTFEARLYGTNLLNEDQRTAGIDFGALGFANDQYARPRVIGFTLLDKF